MESIVPRYSLFVALPLTDNVRIRKGNKQSNHTYLQLRPLLKLKGDRRTDSLDISALQILLFTIKVVQRSGLSLALDIRGRRGEGKEQ